jgi:hypothetical protein
MTTEELSMEVDRKKANGYKTHHVSLSRGYYAKNDGWLEKYSGRFGKGYKVYWPNDTYGGGGHHHIIEYLIKE